MSSVRRRFLIPEVVQTSAMDCGPAAVKSLLEGFGIRVNYERLREACQTSVDGTSIDTVEDLLNRLGLVAEQALLPSEHILLPEADALPALAIINLPSNQTHFLVLWRVAGDRVQVMDPARGRRWLKKDDLLRQLYIHYATIPVSAFREWTQSSEFVACLTRRLRNIGVPDGSRLLTDAFADPSWRSVARLEAYVRFAEGLANDVGLSPGETAGAFSGLVACGASGSNEAFPPTPLWMASPGETMAVGDGEEVEETVRIRGVPFVRVNTPEGAGKEESEGESSPIPLESELRTALNQRGVRPMHALWSLLRERESWRPWFLLLALVITGVGAVVEAVLLRGLFDLPMRLPLVEQRFVAVVVIAIFCLAMLFLDWPNSIGLSSLGRAIEIGLRRKFLLRIPQLDDRYFQSRPISDMATRAHQVQFLRVLPMMFGHLFRAVVQMVIIAVGMIVIYPRGAFWVLALAGSMIAIPLMSQPALLERDLRMRTHAAALAGFYLDSLLGLLPVRAHAGELAMVGEHGLRLREWAKSAWQITRATVRVEMATLVVGFVLCAALLHSYLAHGQGTGWSILLLYWGVGIPLLGQEIAFLLRQYPLSRNIVLRLLEPLVQRVETAPASEPTAQSESAVAIRMSNVVVVAAGHDILRLDELEIAPGAHVAIVGTSGAGKSSLAGLLLGWHRPAQGAVFCDGELLVGPALVHLRRDTVWVDPSVQVWNRSLLDNLRYGSIENDKPVGEALETADLDEVLARLPWGLQTLLGEDGGLLSGGEGQRVRLGRAVHRGMPRLVVLDEAFRGLPRAQRQALLGRARERWNAATLLFITHDVGDTVGFDRVLVVDSGLIKEDGPPPLLAAQAESRYRALLDAEARVAAMFRDGQWRRWRVADGKVQ